MHVAITYPFPIGRASGGARMTREIAAHLARMGPKVTLLPVSASPGTRWPRPAVEESGLGFEFDPALREAGVAVSRVSQHPLHWMLDGWQVRRRLAALLRREKVDAVLSYYQDGAYLPAFLKRRGVCFGFISTWQSYALALDEERPRPLLKQRARTWLNDRLVRLPHRSARVLFPTSEFTRRELVELLGVDAARTRVCYLGVEPAFERIPREPRSEVRNLVFFGRLVATKGVQDALEALAVVKSQGLDGWRFRMMGQGNRSWVQGIAAGLGIGDRVEILPPVGDRELHQELAWADMAVMPSHAEAFGLSIAEAQAAALPVAAYQAGSVPEVVADGKTGWLAPFGDVEGLAARIAAAIREPAEAQRRGRAGRERVRRLFTWENTARTIFEGLEALL